MSIDLTYFHKHLNNNKKKSRPLMPRDNGFDGTYMRREKQKKEKAVKTSKTTSEKVC